MSKSKAAEGASTQVLLMSVPLLIYFLFFYFVLPNPEWEQLGHKPEWMFIALMYAIEMTRDGVILRKNARRLGGEDLDIHIILSVVVIAITCAALFAVLGRYEKVFAGSSVLSQFQWIILALNIVACWHLKYLLRRPQIPAVDAP